MNKEPIKQDKNYKIIYAILLTLGIMGIVYAAKRAETISHWISGISSK
jgi:hypothetical protein